MKNNEQLQPGHEHYQNPDDIEAAGDRQREVLREQHEQNAERAPEAQLETARTKALEQATSANHEKLDHTSHEKTHHERRRGAISRKERDASYQATMKEIQTHMSPAGRAFSKVIHNKAVERVSETLAATVARPNAILSGAIAAFVISLAALLIAKHYGYRLSGFEAIGAFAAGWLIGILYDFFKVMITGKK